MERVLQWQYCRAGEYACTSSVALVVLFDYTNTSGHDDHAMHLLPDPTLGSFSLNLNTSSSDVASTHGPHRGDAQDRRARAAGSDDDDGDDGDDGGDHGGDHESSGVDSSDAQRLNSASSA